MFIFILLSNNVFILSCILSSSINEILYPTLIANCSLSIFSNKLGINLANLIYLATVFLDKLYSLPTFSILYSVLILLSSIRLSISFNKSFLLP